MRWRIAKKLVFCLGLVSLFCIPSTTLAVHTTYDARLLSISAPQEMEVGEMRAVSVTFQNTGTSVWKSDGANYVSIYHWDPVKKQETSSVFASPSWIKREQPLLLPVATVARGWQVTFQFFVQAPRTAGIYHGDFILTVEDAAWIKNGKFSLNIVVKASNSEPPRVISPSAMSTQAEWKNETMWSEKSMKQSTEKKGGTWSAQLVEKGGTEWQLDAQSKARIELAFKNMGSIPWRRDGQAFVSLYATNGRKQRASPFRGEDWMSSTQTARLKEAIVQLGEIGHVMFEIQAPMQSGLYRETFTLAAEDTAWIFGGVVELPIRVPDSSGFIATAPLNAADVMKDFVDPSKPPSGIYTGALLLRSAKTFSLAGGNRQELTLGFKNTGPVPWSSRSLRLEQVQAATMIRTSAVRDETWPSQNEAAYMQVTTKPGEIGFVTFHFKAPPKRGTYSASFQLYADGQSVEGAEADIPITVTEDGPDIIEPEPLQIQSHSTSSEQQSSTTTPIPPTTSVQQLFFAEEPMIRVGLFKTSDDRMVIRARFAPLEVVRGTSVLCQVLQDAIVTVSFDRFTQAYRVEGSSCNDQSQEGYLVRAVDRISPMEIADFSRPIAWLPGANDNTFRRQLELRFAPLTGNVWVINELPIEWYLKGIAETSDRSPVEFQKTLLTAARTYAVYHLRRPRKHASEFFTVDATYDQVYRGYGAEERSPKIARSVDATRGQIVMYEGKLAVTPYFSRSDGRTRAWEEVWAGGAIPWLTSVQIPWDKGKTLWGHGVGMSASGALGMAYDGKNYQEILKVFYHGTELMKVYP